MKIYIKEVKQVETETESWTEIRAILILPTPSVSRLEYGSEEFKKFGEISNKARAEILALHLGEAELTQKEEK